MRGAPASRLRGRSHDAVRAARISRSTRQSPLANIEEMQSVLTTPTFEATARSEGLEDHDVLGIILRIAADPTAGALMAGTGGARKLRHAGRGKGKSGGYRSIYYFGGDDIPIFLLAVYGKGKKVNLTQAERNALRAELSNLAEDYRSGVEQRLRQLKPR